MATATVERPEVPVTFTLVLSEEEALYVWAALLRTEPSPEDRFGPEGEDPVYDALNNALFEAGVSTSAKGATGYVRR